MEKVVNNAVPVVFQKLHNYEVNDDRFVKVKIWLMHLGENYNSSYFDKKAVEEAIPTLANTPILAYIEDNSDGEKDFSDHRMVLVRDDDGIKLKYIGTAIGLIPETNNAKFEMRVGDDGVEREYLTVEGLVWTKWDDPIDIFDRDAKKQQSMELHENHSGYWGDDGLYHFTKFSFFGACALGSDVLPAMHNATIEAQFSQEKMFSYIQDKLEEFKQFSRKSEGGVEMEKNESVETVEEETTTEEVVTEYTVEAAEEVVEKDEDVENTESKEDVAQVEEVDYQSKFETLEKEFNALKDNYTAIENEITQLREFKSSKLAEERAQAENDLYNRFASELTEEEIANVKEAASEFSLDQLEEKLFTLVGKKKATFSKQEKKEKSSIKINLDFNNDEVKPDKPYSDLISKYSK